MSSNGNSFDQKVDEIADFFKKGIKVVQVVTDLGLDKPPPVEVGFTEAKNLFEAWSRVFVKRKAWAELDRDTQYRWLEVVKVQKGL